MFLSLCLEAYTPPPTGSDLNQGIAEDEHKIDEFDDEKKQARGTKDVK